jgi:hypothetical protein
MGRERQNYPEIRLTRDLRREVLSRALYSDDFACLIPQLTASSLWALVKGTLSIRSLSFPITNG